GRTGLLPAGRLAISRHSFARSASTLGEQCHSRGRVQDASGCQRGNGVGGELILESARGLRKWIAWLTRRMARRFDSSVGFRYPLASLHILYSSNTAASGISLGELGRGLCIVRVLRRDYRSWLSW